MLKIIFQCKTKEDIPKSTTTQKVLFAGLVRFEHVLWEVFVGIPYLTVAAVNDFFFFHFNYILKIIIIFFYFQLFY